MEFSQYMWDLYKESSDGKKIIESFNITSEIDIEKHIGLYNKSLIKNAKFIADISETIYCYNVSDYEPPANFEEAIELYKSVIFSEINDSEVCIIDHGDYEMMLAANIAISYALYVFSPEYYFPNLFKCNFLVLNRIVDNFGIELPSIPKKSDYKARCMYYMDLCKSFYDFRIKNNLSPPELCAFLYDFAPKLVKQKETPIMPEPAQAWFIGGNLTKLDKKLGEIDFWQANPETKKGDILVMYEKTPISAITSIWRARVDGVIDPFFHFYSNTAITDEIQIPHISLTELKADSYFSSHSLIRKNFQGVNGWQISSEDYSELIRIIKKKEGKIEKLPKLYKPTIRKNISITCEKDVEKKLLEPFLQELGVSPNDYIRQLPIRAGRGSKIYPDYALFYDNTSGYEKAKVLIEAKYLMKNNKEIEECFKQARSYANILESNTIVICDMNYIMIYEKNEGFDRTNYCKYYWEEIENPDKFREIKRKINK
ncbi:MAG: type I restriction endonuclease subunit R [Prevotellaceae bacterium]|jgi:hypothetical protein|nr:type I restriction endonuclease subunit R [Prevotellaceae bacterium]